MPDNGGLAIVTDIDCNLGGIRIYARNRNLDNRITLFANSVINNEICNCATNECDTTTIPMIINLGDVNLTEKAGIYDSEEQPHFTNEINTGYLQINKLNTSEKIISGVFSFDALSELDNVTVVQIREGRFDIKF